MDSHRRLEARYSCKHEHKLVLQGGTHRSNLNNWPYDKGKTGPSKQKKTVSPDRLS